MYIYMIVPSKSFPFTVAESCHSNKDQSNNCQWNNYTRSNGTPWSLRKETDFILINTNLTSIRKPIINTKSLQMNTTRRIMILSWDK